MGKTSAKQGRTVAADRKPDMRINNSDELKAFLSILPSPGYIFISLGLEK
jgi:hypothetical protein